MPQNINIPLLSLLIILSIGLTIWSRNKPKIDLNRTTIRELQSIPGIGRSYAERIINERDRRGGFRTVNDLLKVRGIGRKRLDKIKPYVEVNALKRNSHCREQTSIHSISLKGEKND